jgi:hypothetical protein
MHDMAKTRQQYLEFLLENKEPKFYNSLNYYIQSSMPFVVSLKESA